MSDHVQSAWNVQFELVEEHFELHADVTWQKGLTGLFGPSGAGKSTFLEILLGLRKPSRGLIKAHGQTLWSHKQHVDIAPSQRNFGWVPQDLLLFPNLTVRENLTFDEPKAEISAELQELLQLGNKMAKWPGQLSGGERQRVALGRALLGRGRALLLDEPVNALDRPLRDRILRHLKEESLRRDIILVSHDRDELRKWCDQILCLEEKRIRIAIEGDFA